MKSAAGLLRSLVRTGTRQSRSVNKLMTALLKAATPPAPKRKRAPAAKVAKAAKPPARAGGGVRPQNRRRRRARVPVRGFNVRPTPPNPPRTPRRRRASGWLRTM